MTVGHNHWWVAGRAARKQVPLRLERGAEPDGGARSATLERMTALSLTRRVRGTIACADHFDFMSVGDTYKLAV